MFDILGLVASFPEKGPYRVDQVQEGQYILTLLFILQIVLAFFVYRERGGSRGRNFVIGSGLLVMVIGFFFALSSWGLGDVTRLSYVLVEYPNIYGWREPLWTLIAPLVKFLPYRFSFIHGCVAACYAASAFWLASRVDSARWGGWWALMVVYSPLLRGFLQSGVTRQALAVVLLVPLMLYCAAGISLTSLRASVLVFFAAIAHSSFFLLLFLAVSPLITGLRCNCLHIRTWLSRFHDYPRLRLTMVLMACGAFVGGYWLIKNFESTKSKLLDYLWTQEYYPHYVLQPEVGRLLLGISLSVLYASFLRRLWPKYFLETRLARSMLLFFLGVLMIRFSIQYGFFPQLAWRLQDAISFYLLITYLAWMSKILMQRLTIIPLFITLHYWLVDRLLLAGSLSCGSNDEFLCIPDRLPWDVTYWG